MGFLVTTLIFLVVGIIASLCTRICFNRGPSANLNLTLSWFLILPTVFGIISSVSEFIWLHLTLLITATVCCWMMWAIVYLAQMKPLIVPILNETE